MRMEKPNKTPPWSVKLPSLRRGRVRASPLLFGSESPGFWILERGMPRLSAHEREDFSHFILFFEEKKFRAETQYSWEGLLAAPILTPQGGEIFATLNFIQRRVLHCIAVATRTARPFRLNCSPSLLYYKEYRPLSFKVPGLPSQLSVEILLQGECYSLNRQRCSSNQIECMLYG
ncbi:hypothetical protein T4A_6187 [Trichinella pseudospiralis]|uniref:Uncharacterized protein n=2 Tax=Trichinella pseudospiralis TaxID=6337 RepID=A0A0V1ITJ7_TRIPS|nr:hypothetical protein T4A_6187 [Trichinella pseudospiralis]KRZ25990.1 hypothetical protein T4C_8096 [Trichinella pseudospiralis]